MVSTLSSQEVHQRQHFLQLTVASRLNRLRQAADSRLSHLLKNRAASARFLHKHGLRRRQTTPCPYAVVPEEAAPHLRICRSEEEQ